MTQTPLFIGLEIPTTNGIVKVFIGIDQEDGHEVSFTTEELIEQAKHTKESPWKDNVTMSVYRGTNGIVFDEKHNLVQHGDKPLSVNNDFEQE